jgi:hypothetical protein
MQSADVTRLLYAIAQESEFAYANSRALFIARATGRSPTLAICELSHSCKRLMTKIRALAKAVTETDRDIAPGDIGSLAELGLRAQTLAVLLLLNDLCDAIPDGTSAYQELFTGRLRSFDDVISFFFDSLARINCLWIRHRDYRALHGTTTPSGSEATRVFLYRLAIHRAQHAVVALGADPDIATFLRVGSSRIDSPGVSGACIEIVKVLVTTFWREPEELFMKLIGSRLSLCIPPDVERESLLSTLASKGYASATDYADSRPQTSLSKLASELGIDSVAPMQLERQLVEEAETTGAMDRCARSLLARDLCGQLPEGWPRGEDPEPLFRRAGVFLTLTMALPDVYERAVERIRHAMEAADIPAGWVPEGADDPILVETFASHWNAPSARA